MERERVVYGIYHGDILGYIGQTCELERRKKRHLNPISRKPRKVDLWLSSVKKDVVFKVLETVYSDDGILDRENYWKKNLKPIVW